MDAAIETPAPGRETGFSAPVLAVLIAGWAAVPVVQFFYEICKVVGTPKNGPGYALAFLFLAAGTAALGAALLSWALLKMPERWLMDFRALPLVLALSLLTTFPCMFLLAGAVNRWFAVGPGERLGLARISYGAFELAPLLVIWSGFFCLAVLGRRRGQERARLARLEAQEQEARLRAIQAESLARQAQLRYLRGQIHPHFIFNALSSAVALVRPAPERAERMMLELGALLRRAIDGADRERIHLGEEIDFLERYLRCMEVRFEGQLRSAIDVPEALRDLPLPPLLLQPLVENAVKHGLKERPRVLVQITARRGQDGRLGIAVANEGRLDASRSPADGGVGLELVRARLAARYPRTGSFHVDEGGGLVMARLAFHPDEGAGAGSSAAALEACGLPR
ncbi:MAG: histidine kinase [Myxococcota bacterium]